MNIDYEPEPDPDDQRDAEIFDQALADADDRRWGLDRRGGETP